MACVTTAANVNDTLMFERLFRAAFAVMVRVRTVFTDKGYDAEANRKLCRDHGAGTIASVNVVGIVCRFGWPRVMQLRW